MVSYPLPPRNFGQPGFGVDFVRFSLEDGNAGRPDTDVIAIADRAEGSTLRVFSSGGHPRPPVAGTGCVVQFPVPAVRRWKW